MRRLWWFLGIGLLVATASSLALGQFSISIGSVVGVLADAVGLDLGSEFTAGDEAVVRSIRLPRVLLAAVIGGALGVAGMTLQAGFRNPLGDAQILGVAGGAATGAALLVSVAGGVGGFAGPIGGVVGAAAGIWAVSTVARYQGRTEVATLILAGVALAAVTAAVVGLLAVVLENDDLRSAQFWLLGSLAGATWRELWITAGVVAAGLALLPSLLARLDILLLGDREAYHVGVAVPKVRRQAMASVAIITGAAVAAAGIIGFVGLLAPHAVRAVIGPGHRRLLGASLAAGALFVIVVDLVARTVAAPSEVPLGVLTALVGGPVFLLLLRRTRAEYGEWG